MNIGGIGSINNTICMPNRTNKNARSFAEFMDKANGDKNSVSDMSVKESAEEISDDKKDMPEEEETRTEVVVRPDGSKVLTITVSVGGQEAVTSVELAKPIRGDIPGRDISGNVDINDTTEKLTEKVDYDEKAYSADSNSAQ